MRKPAWRVIADEIAGKIASGKLQPGARIEPETEIAERLGVSRHTAHRAIHELQRQGLVARQRRWGTVVAERPILRKQRIGYLADFTTNLFQAHLLSHIESNLKQGDRLLVATSLNDSELEAEHLRELQSEVDGLIVYPAEGDGNARIFKEIRESHFPLVLIDRAPRGCEDMVVLTDNVGAAQRAVDLLVTQGHTKIAFFGNNSDKALSNRERHQGYERAVPQLDPKLERWIHVNLSENAESMYQAVSDALVAMMARDVRPTAAFCSQDWLARALILACNDENIEVGKDFAIATYNDFGETFFRFPKRIHRVIQRVDRISELAVERLYRLIGNEPVEAGPIRVEAGLVPAE
ncbi:MAG: LacI family DNA-binding transcriptional regulator [Armatimonadetes bacterium]|nr:LacI family DNA-binding transcriptional regulator [Armatimonadota bacterium]